MLIRRILVALAVCLPAVALAGCGSGSDDYLVIGGGGFVFNYRNAQATYGFVVGAKRAIPDGATIEARFEDPGGGEPILVSKPVSGGTQRYEFQTPPVRGVAKGRPYKVVLVLLAKNGTELQRIERSYISELSQDVLPERPLAIGPGYQANIDGSTTPFAPSLTGPKAGGPPGR